MGKRIQDAQRGNLSNLQRLQIIKYKEEHPDATLRTIAMWAKAKFSLTKAPNDSTISRTLSRKEEFKSLPSQDESMRRKRSVVDNNLDRAIAIWVDQMNQQGLNVSGPSIKQKGADLAAKMGISGSMMKFSNGWLNSFCKRHGFKQFKIHGESGAAETYGTDYEVALERIRLKTREYERSDIYNFDESALFWKLVPDKTIVRHSVEGSEKNKTRMTIAFTCNADGTDRFEPLFIGHAAKPRCFGEKTGAELGFLYFNNKKAWMTGELFDQYLCRFNLHVDRKVLLIIDNAPSHLFNKEKYPNLDIEFLPPNTTSKLQPLDAGIIAAFKQHYRRRQLSHIVNLVEDGRQSDPYNIDQLRGMRWSRHA
jgi:hypothetical protein